jgi:dihydrofolate reductase
MIMQPVTAQRRLARLQTYKVNSMPGPRRIEGFAIVSEDGMLANAEGIMPDSLKFEADRQFFECGLDGVNVVVHGRHSHERQPRSHLRHRLILTRQVPAIAGDPSNEKALFWNPAGASFEQALAVLGTSDGRVGVVGGTEVFGMFLDRYDIFHLSRAPDVRLPGGRVVFPEVATRTPEEVLASHGLHRGQRQVLDLAKGLVIVSWQRSSKPA